MAEAFGIAVGALSLAGLFNNCVDCFEYVQIARNFGRDFHTSQLRLDLAKVRLSRWGQAININGDPRFLQTAPVGEPDSIAKETLWQILLLFSDAAQVSTRFKSTESSAVYNPNADMSDSFRSLHDKLRGLTLQRQKRAGLFQKASWALYHKKNLDRLITDITDLVDNLENLLPEAESRGALQRLVTEEVATLDISDLRSIDEEADDTDKLLRETAKTEIARLEGHSVGNVKLSQQAKGRVGDEYSDAAVTTGYKPGQAAGSSVGDVDASGQAKFHVGHRYGGRSLLDD